MSLNSKRKEIPVLVLYHPVRLSVNSALPEYSLTHPFFLFSPGCYINFIHFFYPFSHRQSPTQERTVPPCPRGGCSRIRLGSFQTGSYITTETSTSHAKHTDIEPSGCQEETGLLDWSWPQRTLDDLLLDHHDSCTVFPDEILR